MIQGGTYSTNSQIKLKITMLKSSVNDYSYAYILVQRTVNLVGQGTDAAAI